MLNPIEAYIQVARAKDAFVPHADELDAARAACKRSRSNKNLARYRAALQAFKEALAAVHDAHAAVAAAEREARRLAKLPDNRQQLDLFAEI